jgi:hypothetical protein
MTNSNDQQAVAVRTRVNAGAPRDGHSGLAASNHPSHRAIRKVSDPQPRIRCAGGLGVAEFAQVKFRNVVMSRHPVLLTFILQGAGVVVAPISHNLATPSERAAKISVRKLLNSD